MREPKPSRRKHIFMITTIIALGLIIGSLAVWGFNPSREFSRLAGVGYLERIGFECQEEFIDFGHYETECSFPRSSAITTAPDEDSYQNIGTDEINPSLAGTYPWIWHSVNGDDYLQHNASRQELVDNPATLELETFIEVATATLFQTEFQDWSIDASQPWQFVVLDDEEAVCQQSPPTSDIRDAIDTYAQHEAEGSTLDLSHEVRAVIKIPMPAEGFFSYNLCINVQYIIDGSTIQSAWVKFTLPWPEFDNQIIEKGNSLFITEVFDTQDAQQILNPQSGLVSAGSMNANTHLVPLQYVVVALPAGWTTLTFTQKRDLNPYGCQYLYEIDLATGRCLNGYYELLGDGGTPDWLTVNYTYLEGELNNDNIQDINPYNCFDFFQIDLATGRCFGGHWRVSDYSNDMQPEDVLAAAGNNNTALEIDTTALQGVTLRVLTFKDQTAKEVYFLTNSSEHPCRLVNEGQRDYIIEGDLYLIYPRDETIDDLITPHPLKQIFEAIEAVNEADAEAKLHGLKACQDITFKIDAELLAICENTASGSDCQFPGRASELSELIKPVAEACQAMYERLTNENLDAPRKTDLADCLQLQGAVRDDFLEITSIDSQADAPQDYPHGRYDLSTRIPHVTWKDGYIDSDRGQLYFEYVALHEYLHKVYSQDLTFKERLRFNQEILQFYEDKTKVVIDFVGSSDFSFETKHTTVRHQNVSTISINNIKSIIDRVNDDEVASQIRAALPFELRQEYAEFLDDRYGLVAFLYGLSETPSYIDQDADEGYQTADTSNYFGLSNEFLRINDIFTESIDSDYEETGRLYDDFVLRCARGHSHDFYYTDCLYTELYNFFVEGYAMIGPTLTVTLSPWLEDHYKQYFDRQALSHYFKYNLKSEFDYLN